MQTWVGCLQEFFKNEMNTCIGKKNSVRMGFDSAQMWATTKHKNPTGSEKPPNISAGSMYLGSHIAHTPRCMSQCHPFFCSRMPICLPMLPISTITGAGFFHQNDDVVETFWRWTLETTCGILAIFHLNSTIRPAWKTRNQSKGYQRSGRNDKWVYWCALEHTEDSGRR